MLDPARLAALEATGLVDTDPEEGFDRLTALSAQATGAPVSLVTLIGGDRSFFKSAHGLPAVPPGRSVPLSHSMCQHVVASGEPLAVDDTRSHALLRDNGAVTELGAGAYLGVPLRSPSGHVIGTVCAVDLDAREWSDGDAAALLAAAAAAQGEVALQAEREARALAERMTRLKGAFLSNMSHEIRTPLTAILGSAEMLHDEIGDESRDLTTAILSGGNRLMSTLNAVLDLAQIDAGHMEPQPRPTDVAALIAAAVADVRPLAQAKALTLTADVPAGLHATLDPGLFDRAMSNLIGNAVKYTVAGGVAVRAAVDGAELRVEVADTGIGIAEADLPYLFDEFQQVSDGHARTHEGNGLGLALVGRVSDLMGGRVSVESELGVGSRFTLAVPTVAPGEP